MKILVVDDDEATRYTIKHTLEKAGFEVVVACDGLEALDLLRKKLIQLVISDWGMPNLNGLELCRIIRGGDFHRYIYFILLTCHTRPQDTLEGLEAGADDFIAKPFNPTELLLRVNVGRRTVSLDTCGLTIFALGKVAESRDAETGAHLDRISSYCRILANRLFDEQREGYEIDEKYVQLIQRTSPLHDIGKIAIPDCILLKPDRLTENEFEIMKMHTVMGARMLDAAVREFPNAEFLRMAKEIALSHHERFDGKGYPLGISGKMIPLCGRIAALADVYDALTTRRSYKEAYSHSYAKSVITEQSQGQFDPVIIEAFLAEEKQFTRICAEFAEESDDSLFNYATDAYALTIDEVNQ
jgi:putative two-component system response regulator